MLKEEEKGVRVDVPHSIAIYYGASQPRNIVRPSGTSAKPNME
jgi:hypothetical protein